MRGISRYWMTCLLAVVLLGAGVLAVAGVPVEPEGTAGAVVRAEGTGAPWIRFQEEGVGVPGRVEAKGGGLGAPLSSASLDVTGDGLADLVAGYAGGSGGRLGVFPGNPDAYFPHGPEARKHKAAGTFTKAPFLALMTTVQVAASPDFLAAGNVCPGGKAGVVLGSSGGTKLYFYAVDGKGGLVPAGEAELGGQLTALTAGDFNRPNGVASVVAGVLAAKGPQVAVFHGALVAEASVGMPQAVTGLGLGRLGPGAFVDLAVASGDTLVLVQGRDGFVATSRGAVAPAPVVDKRSFGTPIVSLAVGRFTGGNENSVALLLQDGSVQVVTPSYEKGSVKEAVSKQKALTPSALSTWTAEGKGSYGGATRILGARISTRPGGEDLVVVSPGQRTVSVVEGEKAGSSVTERLSLSEEAGPVLAARLNASALDGLVFLKRGSGQPVSEVTPAGTIFWVTDTGDSGPGTLRQAMLDANANPGLDTILFNIPAGSFAGTPVITLMTPLPQVTDPVIIDGTSQWSYYWGGLGNGVVLINGSFISVPVGAVVGAPPSMPAPVIDVAAGYTTVQGLEIEGGLVGIQFGVNGVNVAAAIFTGGTGAQPDGGKKEGALISGNLIGVLILDTPFNWVGGTTPAEGCVISGNGAGVVIYGYKAVQNTVFGNLIGTDVSGQYANGNDLAGVLVVLAETNLIGTGSPVAANIISGNGLYGGIQPTQAGIGNDLGMGVLILGAYPGGQPAERGGSTDRPPTAHVPGMPTPQGFFASLNALNPGRAPVNPLGFDDGFAIGNVVQANYIGTNAQGNMAVPNATEGVAVAASYYTTVGGGAPARNVISGNGDFGVAAVGALGIKVQGNYIGPAVTGDFPVQYNGYANYTGNYMGGVLLADLWYVSGCPYMILPTIGEVGGTDLGEGNLISGNSGDGIDFLGMPACQGPPGPFGTRTESDFMYDAIVGNFIGLDVTGRNAMGNAYDGIYAEYTYSDYAHDGLLIGGWDPSMRNVISGNGRYETVKAAAKLGHTRGARAEDVPSGNGYGIEMYYGDWSGIFGNYVGTDVTGTATLPNAYSGIHLDDTWFATVGNTNFGLTPPRRGPVRHEDGYNPLDSGGNLISGNYGDGIYLYYCQYLSIYDNFIGTDVTGTQGEMGNGGEGVYLEDCNWYLGGYAATRGAQAARAPHPMGGARNPWSVASGTQFHRAPPAGARGEADGGYYGIDIAGNLISGNEDDGVELWDTGYTWVGYNYIGTDWSGSLALGNLGDGIEDGYGYANTFESNLISANGYEEGSGVYIDDDCDEYYQYDQVIDNYIGTDYTGTQDLHNYDNGITVGNGAGNWFAENLVAFNQGSGVYLGENCYDFYNQITKNSIFDNTDEGITLGYDPYDGHTNDGIPFPWLFKAITNGENTLVLGQWAPYWSPGNVTMEYFTNDRCGPPTGGDGPSGLRPNAHGKEFIPSGYGQGKYYQTSDYPGTDASGNFASLIGPLDEGDILTATATAYFGGVGVAPRAKGPARPTRQENGGPRDTSEFSNCIDVVACPTILVTACAASIDTTPQWYGGTVCSFGDPDTATYGQTITVPGSGPQILDGFTFYMDLPASCTFRGYIYAWNGSQASGPQLWASAPMNTLGSGIQAVNFNTGGVTLTGGSQYVLFASISEAATTGYGCWGFVSDTAYTGGTFVFINNGYDPSQWTTGSWSTNWGGDLEFKVNFQCIQDGTVGTAYSANIGATGGQGPYLYSYTGTLPPGLTLDPNTGALTGTPTEGGDFTFIITARDTNGGLVPDGFCFGTGTFTIHVTWPSIVCAGVILPATPISATAGTPVTFSVGTVTGGDGGPYTYSWNLGGLPPGNLQTGSPVTQTYMANGTLTVTLTITDSHGNTCTDTAQVTVTGGGPYDMFFKDLYGRSTMCANSATGAYVFNILTGLGAGFGYTGTAIVTSSLGGVINLNTPVSDPNRVQLTWVIAADKANGTFANGLVPAKQVLSDITVSANTNAVCNPFAPPPPPAPPKG